MYIQIRNTTLRFCSTLFGIILNFHIKIISEVEKVLEIVLIPTWWVVDFPFIYRKKKLLLAVLRRRLMNFRHIVVHPFIVKYIYRNIFIIS